jgi:hypothetical protein
VNLTPNYMDIADRAGLDMYTDQYQSGEPRVSFRPQRGQRMPRWLLGLGIVGFAGIVSCAPAAAPSAPTVTTAATAVASPAGSPAVAVASPVATLVAASPVRITAAQITPSDATVGVQNAGTAAVDMTGWKLRVGTATVTLPGNSRVAPGEAVTIHTASGTSAEKDLYLGSESAALMTGLQPGATVSLLDAQGAAVSEFVLPR